MDLQLRVRILEEMARLHPVASETQKAEWKKERESVLAATRRATVRG
jgi:hypothetical protein